MKLCDTQMSLTKKIIQKLSGSTFYTFSPICPKMCIYSKRVELHKTEVVYNTHKYVQQQVQVMRRRSYVRSLIAN